MRTGTVDPVGGGSEARKWRVRLGRMGDLLLAAVAVALVATVTVALVDGARSGGFGDGLAEPPEPSPFPGQDMVIATLNYVTVSQTDRTVGAELQVDISLDWLESLQWEDGTSALPCAGTTDPCNGHDGREVILELRYGHGTEELGRTRLPLFGPGVTPETIVQPVEVPVVGTPLRFPDDRYRAAELWVALVTPPGITAELFSASTAIIDVRSQYFFTLREAGGLGDYSADVAPVLAYEEPMLESPVETGDTRLEVVRRPRARFVIYGLAVAPLLLAVVVLRRSWSQAAAGGPTRSTFELAAALIAIVPLREALVPEGIGGLTRLDYLLSGEVVVIIAVASLLLLRAPAPAPAPAATSAPRQAVAAATTEPPWTIGAAAVVLVLAAWALGRRLLRPRR